MELSESDPLALRREYERIELRSRELQSSEASREARAAERRLESAQRSFKSYCEALRNEGSQHSKASVRAFEAREAEKRLRGMRTEVSKAKVATEQGRAASREALARLAVSKKRSEKLDALLLQAKLRKEKLRDAGANEELSELRANKKDLSRPGHLREGSGAVEKDFRLKSEVKTAAHEESKAKAQVLRKTSDAQEAGGGVAQTSAAPQPSAREAAPVLDGSQFQSLSAQLAGQGHGSNGSYQHQDSRGTPPHSETSSQATGSGGRPAATITGFEDRMSEVRGWDDRSNSGFSFAYTTERGECVRVKLERDASGKVSLAIEPESLAEQRSMARAMRALQADVERAGIKVSGIHVGAVRRGSL